MSERKSEPWVIWYATILQATWGVCMLGWPESAGATAPSAIRDLMRSTPLAAAVLLVASGMAVYVMFAQRRLATLFGSTLLVPQQYLLFVAAAGAMGAILRGTFADGVPRPWAFIATDQAPTVVLAVVHGIALLDRHRADIASWIARVAGGR